METRLILASVSERRRKILDALGASFVVEIPDVEEVCYEDDPRATVTENALRKNEWCSKKCPEDYVIAADMAIDFEGRCITKPSSVDEARAMLRAFSGKLQKVLTAVAFSIPAEPGASDSATVEVVESSVVFKDLDDRIIDEYFSRVDPIDKAGAYDIDQHGELIIESFSGSRTNIMGLPEETVADWLKEHALL